MTATAILTFYAFILFVFYLYFIFIIQALENLLLGRPPSSWETSFFLGDLLVFVFEKVSCYTCVSKHLCHKMSGYIRLRILVAVFLSKNPTT